MTPQEREEIRKRLRKITPGQWRYDFINMEVQSSLTDDPTGPFRIVVELDGVDGWVPNGEFIAYAPDDIRALLAEVDRLTGELAAMTAAHEAAIRERDEAQNAVADLAVGRRQMQLQRERAEARIRELEQERA